MTLVFRAEHGILNALVEPAVAHITFASEACMNLFITDNAGYFRQKYESWTMDFVPVLTVTAK